MRSSITALTVLHLWTVVVGNAWGVVQYTITPLNAPANTYSYPRGLNDTGTVVGRYDATPGSNEVGIWQSGALTNLGTLGRTHAWATRINTSGQVIGTAQQQNGNYYYNEAFTLQNGPPTFLGILGTTGKSGEGSNASDINSDAQIIGTSSTGTLDVNGNPVRHGFLWENGTMTDIGVPSGQYVHVSVTAINAGGTVVGYASHPGSPVESEFTAFTWNKNVGFQLLPNVLGTGRLFPLDINDSGRIVGTYETTPFGSPGSQTKPFYYDGTVMTDLPVPPGFETRAVYASQINNRGQIVGYAAGGTPITWENGTCYNINDLVPSGSGPFDASSGISINDVGQIVVTKSLPSGVSGFLLTPVPEPSTFVLLGMGAVGLLGFAWRRWRAST